MAKNDFFTDNEIRKTLSADGFTFPVIPGYWNERKENNQCSYCDNGTVSRQMDVDYYKESKCLECDGTGERPETRCEFYWRKVEEIEASSEEE